MQSPSNVARIDVHSQGLSSEAARLPTWLRMPGGLFRREGRRSGAFVPLFSTHPWREAMRLIWIGSFCSLLREVCMKLLPRKVQSYRVPIASWA